MIKLKAVKDMIQFAGVVTMYLYSVNVYHNATPKTIISPVEAMSPETEIVMDKPMPQTDPTWDEIETYIREVFPERADEAVATFKHENGYQLRDGWDATNVTWNDNGSSDTGIAKINSIHKDCGDLTYYKDNIDCARKLYDERESWGVDQLSAWYSYVNDKHEMFL